MLKGFTTKNGTGITIYGDYVDLKTIHNVIAKISERVAKEEDNPLFIALMDFSYEVRKAYSGQRLKEKITFDEFEAIEYYGFQYLWTDLIIFIKVLRHEASFAILNELDQSTLYLIEHTAKTSLSQYDLEGAAKLNNLFDYGINILDNLLIQILEYVNILYLSQKPSKTRFRNLAQLITSHFSGHTKEGKEIRDLLNYKAKEINLEPNKIKFDEKEFPSIIW